MEKMDVVEQNLKIAQNFEPLSSSAMDELRSRSMQHADGRFELYKVSLKYDNPEARLAHGFPLDMKSKEVQEMLHSTDNSGKPFPAVK
jgi:hypothetical protein